MAMTIKVLALEQLTNTTPARSLYKASATAPMKTAVVKTMRFTGVATMGTLKLNVYFVPSGSTYPTNARRIIPKDQLLPAGYEVIDDTELTLGPGDSIYAETSITGVSNPPPNGPWVDFSVAWLEHA
jgi:hypothetical protein